ncbi:MAG: hypothetical protein HY248_03695 [Fimbriimonas ginsengisoli]|nr:hypothetical protein [Fimbriimonas ginsengisoli]
MGYGERGIRSLCFTPDGQYFAYGRYDATVGFCKNPNWTLPKLSSLSASPNPTAAGANCTGTVTLDCPAPIGDAVVTLSSSDPAIASVPASVTVVVGNKTAAFPVVTGAVASDTVVKLTATHKVSGNVTITRTKQITVTPPALTSLALSAASVTGGATVKGTIQLTGPTAADTPITVESENSAAHPVIPVVVLKGASSVEFDIPTDAVDVLISGKIKVSLNGVLKSVNLAVKPPVLLSLTLSPNPAKGGINVTGTVTMSGPVKSSTTINLTNANAKALLPNGTNADSVIIAAGSSTRDFKMTTVTTTAIVKGPVKAILGSVSTKSVTLTVTP